MVTKGDRLSLRISHLEPEKRRVGFTQRWGTDAAGAEGGEGGEVVPSENGASEPVAENNAAPEAVPAESQSEPAPEADSGDKAE